jgi:hypothetical protein
LAVSITAGARGGTGAVISRELVLTTAFLADGDERITEERVRRELQRRGWPTDEASIDCAISDQDFARECGWLG